MTAADESTRASTAAASHRLAARDFAVEPATPTATT